ncbi:MAG TPA: response regulator [Candidatus Saccharimonadales bacterium]|nr:response regulator [Candidatus Saccharimonadales bacterium]
MSAHQTAMDPRLLIVDDSDDDIFFLTRALRKSGIALPVDCAANGAQGIKYLQSYLNNPHPKDELPSMVLLDLKMPLVDGHQVLEWIRGQPALNQLPVYILSSSQLDLDISKAKKSGAADYWVKPSSLPEYQDLAVRIKTILEPTRPAA